MGAMKSSSVSLNRSSSSRGRRSLICAASSQPRPVKNPRHTPSLISEVPMNKSCLFLSAVLLLTGAPAYAGQAPFAADAPNFPISGRDRVYAAEQFSNTVSVIDRLSRLPFNQQKSRCHSPRRSSADELVAAVQEPSSRSRARLLAGSQDTRGRIDRFKFR